MKMMIPEKVEYIIDSLTACGFEAYAVGGCVRDTIMQRIPQDWDITTSAQPFEVKELFRRTIDTGIEHGTVTVMIGNEGFEVTTYRIDGEYEDNRHPKSVEFTSNLIEDLKRRDFTINAMAYNHSQGLVDEFEGFGDLQKGVIRCVGEASDRFEEDALRMLRAVRFAGQLGFVIDEYTKSAIVEKASLLKNISAERIRVELNKLLLSPSPGKMRDAFYLGITKIVFPEFDEMLNTPQNNPNHIYSVGEHTLQSVKIMHQICFQKDEIDDRLQSILSWTMLLHDVGKPRTKTIEEDGWDKFPGHSEVGEEIAKGILRRLKFDNDTIQTTTRLIRWHGYKFILNPAAMRRAVYQIGEDIIKLLFLVKRADILAQNPDIQREKLSILEVAMKLYAEIEEAKECVNLKTLEVSGKDLIEIGYKPGKIIGEVLESLLDEVLEHPEENKKEKLLELAKKKSEL